MAQSIFLKWNAALSEENISSTLLRMNIRSLYLCSKDNNLLKCQYLGKNIVYDNVYEMQKEKNLRKYWQKLFYKALMKCNLSVMQ